MAKNSVFYLFGGLFLLLCTAPLLNGLPRSDAVIQLAYTTVVVVGVFSLTADRRVFALGVVLAAIGLLTALGYLVTDWTPLRVVDLVSILLFSLVAIGVLMRQLLFSRGTITFHRIVGALCVYMLLGLVWAMLFEVLHMIDPGAFRATSAETDDPSEMLLYFSYVTLTTLGYGDMAPVHPVARSLAAAEAIIGQLFIAVLIAGLVGRYVAEAVSGSRSPESQDSGALSA